MIRLPKLPTPRPRERLLAASTGVVVVAVILDALVLRPWFRHAHTVRQEIQRMEQTLQHHRQLFARQDRLLAQFASYQRYLHPALPDELRMAQLLKEIEGLAGQSGISLAEIKPLAVESDEFTKRYSLDIQFECTLKEWVDFVTDLEASPSLYQIARAGLSAQDERPDRLKASLRVVSAAIRVEDSRAELSRAP